MLRVIFKHGSRVYTLPISLLFEKLEDEHPRSCRYDILGMRRPRRGEHYISGAIPYAYKAPNDLSDEFIVVRPILNAIK